MCLFTHDQFYRLHHLLNGQHSLKTEMNKSKIVWINKCNNQGMNILYSPARIEEWYRNVSDKITRFVASITISDKIATKDFKPIKRSSKTVLTRLLYPRQLICWIQASNFSYLVTYSMSSIGELAGDWNKRCLFWISTILSHACSHVYESRVLKWFPFEHYNFWKQFKFAFNGFHT